MLLDFTREVSTFDGGGVFLVPIDHLKTKNGCRDFSAVYDKASDPQTLDATIWPYCGRNTSPDGPRSQPLSIPLSSAHFQLTAEWGSVFTTVFCERE